MPGLTALAQGGVLALANKESLVCAGPLLRHAAAASGARILPVDSEHNAIFQCLAGQAQDSVRRILLTASPEVRLARRGGEMAGRLDAAQLRDQVLRRDADDSTLVDFTTAADGVVHLDGSFMTLEQTIDAVVGLAERAVARKEAADE